MNKQYIANQQLELHMCHLKPYGPRDELGIERCKRTNGASDP